MKTQHYVIFQLCKLVSILYIKENEKKQDKNLVQRKFTQIGRTRGLPNIHKNYQDVPTFPLIVNTTSSPNYGIAKYLSSLLNSVIINNYSVKDSFEAAKCIQSIHHKLFNQGYKFISFDMTSMFTVLF